MPTFCEFPKAQLVAGVFARAEAIDAGAHVMKATIETKSSRVMRSLEPMSGTPCIGA
jgi:hypothetical protein